MHSVALEKCFPMIGLDLSFETGQNYKMFLASLICSPLFNCNILLFIMQLKMTCSQLAQQLGCTIEGVASESIGDILSRKISILTQEHRLITTQMDTCRGELERVRGDLAATNVKASSLQSQVTQGKNELDRRDTEIAQLKVYAASKSCLLATVHSFVDQILLSYWLFRCSSKTYL